MPGGKPITAEEDQGLRRLLAVLGEMRAHNEQLRAEEMETVE